jgi:hypothetical protein
MSREASHRRSWLVGALFGAVIATIVSVAGPAVAQTATQWIRGGGFAGKVNEAKFVYAHNEGEKLGVDTSRELFKFPAEYGEPFAVTFGNNQHIVWYRSTELGVRNVIIDDGRRLVHLLPRENLQKTAAEEVPAAR